MLPALSLQSPSQFFPSASLGQSHRQSPRAKLSTFFNQATDSRGTSSTKVPSELATPTIMNTKIRFISPNARSGASPEFPELSEGMRTNNSYLIDSSKSIKMGQNPPSQYNRHNRLLGITLARFGSESPKPIQRGTFMLTSVSPESRLPGSVNKFELKANRSDYSPEEVQSSRNATTEVYQQTALKLLQTEPKVLSPTSILNSPLGFGFTKDNFFKKGLYTQEAEPRENKNNLSNDDFKRPSLQKRLPFQLNISQRLGINPRVGPKPSKANEEEMRSHFRLKEDPYNISNAPSSNVTKIEQGPQKSDNRMVKPPSRGSKLDIFSLQNSQPQNASETNGSSTRDRPGRLLITIPKDLSAQRIRTNQSPNNFSQLLQDDNNNSQANPSSTDFPTTANIDQSSCSIALMEERLKQLTERNPSKKKSILKIRLNGGKNPGPSAENSPSSSRRVTFFKSAVKGNLNIRTILWTIVIGPLFMGSMKRWVLAKRIKRSKEFHDSFQENKEVFLKFVMDHLRDPLLRLTKEKKYLYIVDHKASTKDLNSRSLKIHDFLISFLETFILALNADKLPHSIYKSLVSFVEPSGILPHHYLTEFEMYRLEFTHFATIKNPDEPRSKMLLGGYLMLRMLLHEVIMKPWQVLSKFPQDKVNIRNLLNVGSVFYHALIDVFKKSLQPIRNSQGIINVEDRLKYATNLPAATDKVIDDGLSEEQLQKPQTFENEMSKGFYAKALLKNLTQERFVLYQDVKDCIEDALEILYKKTMDEYNENRSNYHEPYLQKQKRGKLV